MEVITSLAIFLLSMIAIGQLLNVSTNLAQDTRDTLRASQLCRSKMNEVVAGAVGLTSQSDITFDEDQNWTWSVECQEESSITNLWRVTVRVRRQRNDNTKIEDSLTQYVLDPAARGTLDAGASSSSSGTTDSGTTTMPMGGQ
jgi:hypothetical protein